MLWFLLACSTPEAPPAERLQAAEHATLATAAELGSYQLTSEVSRTWTTKTGQVRSDVQSTELRWEDPDQWSFLIRRGERVVQRAVVFGGRPWTAMGDQPLTRQGDAEPYRVQLSSVWDPWTIALDQVHEQIELTELRSDALNGREVVVYKAGLKALSPKARPTWKANSVEGEVWIDKLSSVRLQGDILVKSSGKQEDLEIHFQFQLGHIGEAVAITDPAQEEGSRLDEPSRLPEGSRPPRPAPPVARPRPH